MTNRASYALLGATAINAILSALRGQGLVA